MLVSNLPFATMEHLLELGLSEYSIQQSDTGSLAGVKGLYWTEMSAWDSSSDGSGYWVIDLKLNTAPYGQGGREPTATEVEQCFAIGDIVTLHAGNKYDKHFTVVEYSTESSPEYQLRLYTIDPTLTANSFVNKYKADMDFSDNAIFCPAKPDTGVADFGKYSFVAGHNTKALNYGATAFGRDTEAYGQYSMTAGRDTKAGYAAFADGRFAYAEGPNSVATGLRVKATAIGAHAEGGTETSAEANWTVASGKFSHAEGCSVRATGDFSHAEGCFTEANGPCSHAEGYNT
jgi:hypothetical protein